MGNGPSRDLSPEGVEAARRIVERIESDEFDDEALARAVREASASAREQEDIPYVAIGAGERPPWHHLGLNCPTCGEGPLPLRASEPGPGDSSGIVLHFISHCGGTWMRGPIT